jgi:hypothetical protein
MRAEVDLAGELTAGGVQSDLLVNKSRKRLNPVEHGLKLELDSWSFGSVVVVFVASSGISV